MEQHCEMAKFLPPAKKKNQIEQVYYLDDFNKDALRREMFKMFNTGIYPTAAKLVNEIEKSIAFERTARSMYRLLKDIIAATRVPSWRGL